MPIQVFVLMKEKDSFYNAGSYVKDVALAAKYSDDVPGYHSINQMCHDAITHDLSIMELVARVSAAESKFTHMIQNIKKSQALRSFTAIHFPAVSGAYQAFSKLIDNPQLWQSFKDIIEGNNQNVY